MSKYNVRYRIREQTAKRLRVTVEAEDHGDSIRVVEKMIRDAGDTPKSIGPAEEVRVKA